MHKNGRSTTVPAALAWHRSSRGTKMAWFCRKSATFPASDFLTYPLFCLENATFCGLVRHPKQAP